MILIRGSTIGKNTVSINTEDFSEKWDLILAIKTLDDFQTFDKKLSDDQAFREVAVSSLVINTNY